VHIGGVYCGGQIGDPMPVFLKNPVHAARSLTDWVETLVWLSSEYDAKSMFSGYLKKFKKEHIWEMWFNFPINFCNIFKETFSYSNVSEMDPNLSKMDPNVSEMDPSADWIISPGSAQER
jgi:hypothetical protein